MLRRLIGRKRDGTYVLRVNDEIASMLASLVEQLDPLLDDPSADPGVRRLFPPAHPEDLLAEAAWQIEQGGRLRDARRAALDLVRSAGGQPLTAEQLIGWMQGVNALRLFLAERLDVEQDPAAEEAAFATARALAEDDTASVADRDAALHQARIWQVYDMLGHLVAEAVAALDDD